MHMCVSCYMYTKMRICAHKYIYIYIYRERERSINIYVYREREKERYIDNSESLT